jgi:hypothetical protein
MAGRVLSLVGFGHGPHAAGADTVLERGFTRRRAPPNSASYLLARGPPTPSPTRSPWYPIWHPIIRRAAALGFNFRFIGGPSDVRPLGHIMAIVDLPAMGSA